MFACQADLGQISKVDIKIEAIWRRLGSWNKLQGCRQAGIVFLHRFFPNSKQNRPVLAITRLAVQETELLLYDFVSGNVVLGGG